MIGEDSGQMSVEVLFLFAISIMVLLIFTIPIAQLAIATTLDVSNTINAEGELKRLANGIDKVYSEGMGAQKIETLEFNSDISVMVKSKVMSSEVRLHDGKTKGLSQTVKADNLYSNLKLNKGTNKVLIVWSEDSKNIVIKKI